MPCYGMCSIENCINLFHKKSEFFCLVKPLWVSWQMIYIYSVLNVYGVFFCYVSWMASRQEDKNKPDYDDDDDMGPF